MSTRFRLVKTAAGTCWFVSREGRLLRSGLPESSKKAARDRVRAGFPDAVQDESLEPGLCRDLERYFGGEDVSFKVKLDESGLTPFRREVYRALKKVRRGRCVTYAELAEKVGRPGAARGVGGAMAANPFPPIVPCHRVMGSNGRLTGFSGPGGVDLKRKMLETEGAI